MDYKVFALPLAGATRFIYWKPDPSLKKHVHKIWYVDGTLEIECTHKYFDPDIIEQHIRKYLHRVN